MDQVFKIEGNVLMEYLGNEAEVIIPAGIRKIHFDAFYGNDKLRRVVIPEGVEIVESNVFYECRNLCEVVLPETLGRIEFSAFAHCIKLRQIHIPSGVKLIDNGAFADCKQLYKVNIPEEAEVLGGAFHGCPLMEVNFGTREDFSSITDGKLRFIANRCILCGEIMDEAEDGSGLRCSGCGQLHAWEDLYQWDYFEIKDKVCLDYYFGGTKIPDGVTKIDAHAFRDRIVAHLSIPQSVVEIGAGAFSCCDFAMYPALPDALLRLEGEVFRECNFNSIHFSDALEYIGPKCFADCYNLSEIELPDKLKVISDSAFQGCAVLRKIWFGSGLEIIGPSAFEGCELLQKLILPKGVLTIDNQAFANCKGLETVKLNEGLLFIGNRSFEACINLREITIPATVCSIGEGAFHGCTNLKKVRLPEALRELAIPAAFETNVEVEFYTD